MIRPVKSFLRISSYHGQPTNMSLYKRHLGTDYAMAVGGDIVSPVNGTISFSGVSSTLGNWFEIIEAGNSRIHRIAHLSNRLVTTGTVVKEGQLIGKSGNTGLSTGPHTHWDCRRANTTWNQGFNVFYNPESLILANVQKMPPINARIQLIPIDKRTTFKAGTATKVGEINVKDNSYIYTVRGYDTMYKNRIIINSASAGGNGVSLALYYVNGTKIEGWKQL